MVEQIKQGYKQTEVGLIPEDWEVKRLGEIGEFKNGINKSNEDFGFGSPFVNLMDVFGRTKIENNLNFGLINSSEAEKKLYNLMKGDVIFIRSSVKPSGVGLTCVIVNNLPGTVFSGFLIRFRDKGSLTDDYKQHYFYNEKFRTNLISNSTVSANTNINQEALKKLIIAFPKDKLEQTAIARVLSHTDSLIESLDKLIIKKKNIKQGAMQQLLKGKRRLARFNDRWEEIRFTEIFNKIPTKNFQIKTTEYHDFGSYPVIDQGKEKIIGYSDSEVKLFRCPKEGVIVFGDHTREIKYVDFNFVVGADGTQILITSKNNSSKFFYYQLKTKEIPNTGYNRHYKFLKEMILVRPPSEEQIAISHVLSNMDAEIEELEQKRDKYKLLKAGMMQQLLTGRIRLSC